MEEMNYADIVQAEEMADAKFWLERMLMNLTAIASTDEIKPDIYCISQDWGKLRMGASVSGSPLCLAGNIYSIGLGTHAESKIRVRLPSGILRLTGLCGVDDNTSTRKNCKALVFSIEAGRRKIWESRPQLAESEPAEIDIPMKGIHEFVLCVRGPITFAHADWVNLKAHLINGKTVEIGRPAEIFGFSFCYDSTPFIEFFHGWKVRKQSFPEKDGIIQHSIIRTDSRTGLVVICEIKQYSRFPVIEWQLKLKNSSRRCTPIIKDIKSLDVRFKWDDFPYLYYWTGDYCQPDGYEPFRVSLAHDETFQFSPVGGRPTNRAWPYYNLQWPSANRGIIAVIGWPGQWMANFKGAEDSSVHVSAGQQITHFTLLPGEQVRTPISVLMFYRGGFIRSQNLWRRWMMAHNMPRQKGNLPLPMLAAYSGKAAGSEMALETEETQIRSFNAYSRHGIELDCWWMDAGWYPCDGTWSHVGTWDVDETRFPRGIRVISDYCRKKSVKTLVWFEPERVHPDTWLWNNHPEWLLKSNGMSNRLLNLGNPAARRWLINHIDRIIKKQGIDIYRQDFNIDPLPFWLANDKPDRQGITENHYVEGYLSFWKALLKRNPDILIDSCASGGRRNDLETMRLSVPLHKTDYNYQDSAVKQAFHYSLYQWMPYFGAPLWPTDRVDAYAFYSSLVSMTLLNYDPLCSGLDWKLLRKLTEKWRLIAENLYFYGDYYPLIPYNRDEDRWIAWQFHRPDREEGIVQAFRRENCRSASIHLALQGLDPDATYSITDLDAGDKTKKITGRKLMESGISVTTEKAPQAKILIYRKTSHD